MKSVRGRIRFAIIGLLVMLSLHVVLNVPEHVAAQATEPKQVIDAILNDLSQKLGHPVTRTGDVTWTWEQTDFPDSSLGCPQPGKAYAQVVTRGFKVTITVNNTSYDYRATENASVVFLCAGTQATTPATTAVPATAAPGATPGAAQPISSAPTAGQAVPYQKPLAYLGPDSNLYITVPGQGTGTPITGEPATAGSSVKVQPFRQFTWSPDGSKLLFTDVSAHDMYLVASNNKPIVVASGLASQYPGAWSPDGTEFAYAVETRQQQDQGLVRQIQARSVTAPEGTVGNPRVAGSFVETVGCGGAQFDPAELAYGGEAGNGGSAQLLVWLKTGFLYSTACSGTGVALADSGGKILWSLPNVAHVAVSRDRQRAVGIQKTQGASQLVSIDLTTGQAAPVAVEANPDQVAWSADGGSLVYSTLTPGELVQGQPSQLWNQLIGVDQPLAAQSYTVNLWRTSATGGPSTRLFQQEGRGIAVIAPSPDNAGVAFSFIPSSSAFVRQINANAPVAQIRTVTPRPQLYYVDWNGGGANGLIAPLLRLSGQPAYSSGAFTAIFSGAGTLPDNGGNASLPPPNLVVGGQAVVVTPRGDTLNLRQEPNRTAKVLRILKPGTVVTILAGPQSAEGFRWWQIRVNDDNSVGWAVDQVTDKDGTANMLAPQ